MKWHVGSTGIEEPSVSYTCINVCKHCAYTFGVCQCVSSEEAESGDKEGELGGNEEDNSPSYNEALNSFDNEMKWLEKQKECYTYTRLILKRLSNFAGRKSRITETKKIPTFSNN